MDMDDFYETFEGHAPDLLVSILKKSSLPRIFLVGDSSMDNKHWVKNISVEPTPQYQQFLERAVPDLCHCVCSRIPQYICVNAAVEESSLSDRRNNLLPQDLIVRNWMTDKDILMVSVGGNDIALKSTLAIKAHMASLMLLPLSMMKWNPSYKFFVNFFRQGIKDYIDRLTCKRRPLLIVVCGVYFPCQSGSGWADNVLKMLNYDDNPEKLQMVIKEIMGDALSTLRCNSPTVYLPLHEVLDPTDPRDYVARVEPSFRGGMKIAERLRKIVGQLYR